MQENRDLLFTGGVRRTAPREFILEVLEYAKKPLTVEEIHKMVNKKIPCDQATVYRNLRLMVEKEILRDRYFCHGHAHYEIAGVPHSYVVCRYCETIEEMGSNKNEDIARATFKKTSKFAYYDSFSFEIYGVCASCAKVK